MRKFEFLTMALLESVVCDLGGYVDFVAVFVHPDQYVSFCQCYDVQLEYHKPYVVYWVPRKMGNTKVHLYPSTEVAYGDLKVDTK